MYCKLISCSHTFSVCVKHFNVSVSAYAIIIPHMCKAVRKSAVTSYYIVKSFLRNINPTCKGGEDVTINENNFIQQLKMRNAAALDFAVDNYSSLVFKVVRSVLSSSFYSQYIEECVNDIFLSAWNNIESFDEEKGNFRYWITAVAKYKAIDYKRKLFRQSTSECIDDYSLSDEDSTENILVSKETKKELLKAINDMKDEDREIFIRRYFLYEDIENIAKTFGVDRNLIDKRLSRGRKFLKEKLVLLKGEI